MSTAVAEISVMKARLHHDVSIRTIIDDFCTRGRCESCSGLIQEEFVLKMSRNTSALYAVSSF